MADKITDTVKAWSAPALLTVVLVLCGMLWTQQQARIDALEKQVQVSSATITGISVQQQTNTDDRKVFQDAVNVRLDKMQDVLTNVGQSLARLTALQERDEGKGFGP